MRSASEAGSSARLVAGAAGVLAATVQDTHAAIARHHPVLRLLPRPVRRVQHTATTLVYGCVRLGIAAVGAGAAAVLDGRDSRPWTGSARGRRLAGLVDGAFGSHLDAVRFPGLAGPMAVRLDGAGIAVDAATLARHHPAATGRLVVLVHGLIETEEWWRPAPDADDFGARLAADTGATCVRVRYNSGQPITRSGAELAELLGRLVDAWPVPVARIDLVGHSMGGLVARSALQQATGSWASRVRHLVCLGTPHRGSPVERAAHGAALLFTRFDVSRPVGALLDLRSAGIKDLRTGIGDAPVPPTVRHHDLAATLSRTPASLLGRAFGDLLVLPSSALTSVTPGDSRAVGGLSHRDLLHHDAVYATLREWLGSEDPPDRVSW
ncbi:esterase/lipase family protein [Pseudonocardia sp. CA-107938]|uniref:esterase/lipase family protein n=1 Tax=Pseudonocardia sp. CA-107938 TaxID=3240021 RepID=UPI003D8F286A